MSESSKAILEEANAAISDIALQVSFSSQSHLKQDFKSLTGVTPKQVR